MKDMLIGIMRQEQLQLEALIASEMCRTDPDRLRLEGLRREASDLRRQLDRYGDN
ncbi:hypothetical protein [Arenibaculum pallidiluteum]|uniref:hypothetical protein n=1 Tax=Arenibaculum pallidiluteum TaxID=2812559 RepID=UPI001A95B9E8|nr:hypothetical protein [Arenibaculum pallidiluteum]